MSFVLDAPIKDIGLITGVTINTILRRVILNMDSTVLETLRGIQHEQVEISRHEHITLADLLSEGIPVTSLLNSFLNFTSNHGDQTAIRNSSIDGLFDSPRSGSLLMCA